MPPIPVLILFGPTASGKTEIVNRLAACPGGGPAGYRGIELVSADSMQVYRGMDIGTAKPSPEERRRLPHHLIDIRDPNEQFNAGEFVRLADECCARIAGRSSLPVVSGGTGFYLKNFILGLSEAPPSDPEIRAALREELPRRGIESLMEELRRVDPVSAARIHPHDEYRLLRALEVFRLGGRPLSSYCSGLAAPEPQDRDSRYRFLIIGLQRERGELYRRVNERCAAMFRAGLPAEVNALVKRGYGPGDPGMRAIGYREFFIGTTEDGTTEEPRRGFRLATDLAGVEALVAQNSRRYAKRQITYFASIPHVQWIDVEKAGEKSAELVRAMVESSLTSGNSTRRRRQFGPSRT
ncbi:MAG: tRNA (adenosine(37)-N6)-dimethylallyltransferase MiaA [Treponema sp.]|nr:tRNA (adenosine(37)-N6)-dimethylallyltransferase MiaA [Treponema sp.]